jgi:gluconokinase
MAADRRSDLSIAAPIVIVMGVAGAGKSTVGEALAQRLALPFKEGDDLHPPANIDKMRAGIPLDDADRAPWLDAVGVWIDARIAEGEGGVITCSSLKRAYRDRLRNARPQVRFVYLEGPHNLIAQRVAARQHAYMPASLLDSQFADLQPPTPDEQALAVDVRLPLAEKVDRTVHWLGEDAPAS